MGTSDRNLNHLINKKMLTQDNQKNIGSLSRFHPPVPMLHAHVPTETFKNLYSQWWVMGTGRWQRDDGNRAMVTGDGEG